MWNIKYLLSELIRAKSFQEFINRRYSGHVDSDMMVISKKIFKVIGTDYGLFYLDEHWKSIFQIEDYFIENMLSSDIVLDIGANIGAFSIKACRKAKRVYAVEPLFGELIEKNRDLNDIKNISVLKTAMGSGNLDIDYEGGQIEIAGMSLKELIDMCGGHIDFLKCDCEGEEWSIKADELDNIRVVEMEYHISKKEQKIETLLRVFDEAGFEYSKEKKVSLSGNIVGTGLIHAIRRNHK